MAVATTLPVEELSLALALYCRLHGDNIRSIRGHLDLTPRSHFDEACVWAKSNASLVDKMRTNPAQLKSGAYTINEARGWVSRLFGLGRAKNADDLAESEMEQIAREAASMRQPIDEEKARSRAEIRDLVDDAFEAS